ncbi:hypothetical protein BH24PSE2_BH24PSE2_11300 [soil metagenome]
MAFIYPVVGDWYRKPRGNLFEVVAIDEDDGTVEVQHFDGTVEEIDIEAWHEMVLDTAEAPEDWSGSVDADPDDLNPDATGNGSHNDWATALDQLDLDRT